jgi:hypothetical protein
LIERRTKYCRARSCPRDIKAVLRDRARHHCCHDIAALAS